MPGFRQHFYSMLNTTVEGTIERDDQKYGRQLATVFEKAATRLRLAFGGATLLQPRKRLTEPPNIVAARKAGRLTQPTVEALTALGLNERLAATLSGAIVKSRERGVYTLSLTDGPKKYKIDLAPMESPLI